ncbi:hypothetical protein I4U23_013828 [Adineta vaga]|nr:hypothetical protein I4U23_013828 [Adineta vaga]
MILCYDTNELNNDSIRMFINHYLITAIRKARSIDECNDLECDISELWIVTMKLCTDDYFMNCIILNDKHINFLHLITRDFFVYTDDSTINYLPYRFIVLALANILWSISFHELYCKNLLKNFPDLFGRLELIRLDDTIDKVVLDDYIPRHMYSFKRVADGIYHNLRTFQSTKSSISISKSLSTKKSIHSLIISYAHDDIDFCQQLHDVLVKLPQLSVSVNFNNGKYLWEEIAQTIKQSHLVLFLVSQHFYHSLSCRQEFTYATNTLNKLFIPIIIDADYQAKGWLETRVKHIRFVEGNFSNNCDELFSMMSEYLSVDLPSISSLKNSTNIKQWDSADVQRWFINNGIKSELYEFYQFVNGNELFLYAKAILEFPWTKEYERIKLRFEEKFNEHDQHLSSYEFLKFINALEQLRNRYFILFKTN